MWSFGCIIAEMFSGMPLFPGTDEKNQIALFLEVLGEPSPKVQYDGSRSVLFFNSNGRAREMLNAKGKPIVPGSKSLLELLVYETCSELFFDFLSKIFVWDKDFRMTPEEALSHEWILEGLSTNVML
jgi:dual specificity tyrosine-phosphorylation-regulated kinase 2/3/4